jgi:hypothetical protein
MNRIHLTFTTLLIAFCSSLVAAEAPEKAAVNAVPDKLADAINAVGALSVFKFGKLDQLSITKLKGLESAPAFNATDNLYLAKLNTDHPPLGWGAAGLVRGVTLTPVKVFRGLAKPNVAIKLRRRNPNNLRRVPQAGGLIEGSFYVVEARAGFVKSLTPATPNLVQRAYVQGKLPLGWTIKDGSPKSPFKAKGPRKATPSWTCSTTGLSPAILDEGVTITCKPVPPVKKIKWTNPEGDGYVTVTITNTRKTPVEVSALRVADGKIDWAGSLTSFTYLGLPRSPKWSAAQPFKTVKPITKKKVVGSVVLDPNESVSCQVCILDLDGAGNVGGASRRHYIFALGQKTTSLSFYWYDMHHGKLRKKLLAAQKKK